ncbi:MAG: nuclear transport factor 2 family protein, partial [Hyphomonadaceae bacterium]
ANDLDGMMECCADDIVFESINNPYGSVRLVGKAEVRGLLEATTQAFQERRQKLVGMIVDGDRVAAETMFSGVAATEMGQHVRAGEHVSIRGATIFEVSGDRLSRICDYS